MVVDAFDRIVGRFDEATGPSLDVLRGRTIRRRRRRARRNVGVFVAALVLVGAGIALAAGERQEGPQRVTSNQSSTTGVPTTAMPQASGPGVFTIGSVPDDLAFQSCGFIDDHAQPFAYCRYDNPSSNPEVDGLTVSRGIGAVTPEVRAAWEARNASEVTRLVTGAPVRPGADGRFVTIAGAPAITYGVTEVVDGSSLGLPDRVARSFLALVGDDAIQISAEHVTDAQVGEVLASIGSTPAEPGLRLDHAALPRGAQLVVQGARPRWLQPSEFDPTKSTRAGGTRIGALYQVPGSRSPLDIEVASGVDADALLDSVQRRPGHEQADETLDGHRSVAVAADDILPRGLAVGRSSPSLLVAIGDHTVVQISGDRRQQDQFGSIAIAVIASLADG